MSERMRKVNSVIKREVSELIIKNADFKPNVFVTISKVDTTSDLRYTRIFVRVIPYSDIDYAMKTLEHEKIAIQNILHKLLHLKILPKISFVHDKTGDDVDEIERLLQE
ncbi:MAG TPA: 30S ribosome-binding factor RbfA [Candidatus Pacebacteria bacterium]|nr:30S ribosome-binding factor RbfA [Candidatus Paceibacterota bacterium]